MKVEGSKPPVFVLRGPCSMDGPVRNARSLTAPVEVCAGILFQRPCRSTCGWRRDESELFVKVVISLIHIGIDREKPPCLNTRIREWHLSLPLYPETLC